MEVIERKSCWELPRRLKAQMDACPNVAKAFREAGLNTTTAYAIVSGEKPSVELSALKQICKALGCTLQDLGVKGYSQSPQPIAEAPVGGPVLGVWRHSDRVDFLSCYLHRSGEWYLTNDTAMARPMRAPDGWLPLPVIDGGGVEKLIEEKE